MGPSGHSAVSHGHPTARAAGWASPSSPEGCSSQRGKGPLSLERAALPQEEGNLALNLCPEARPGRAGEEGREENSAFSAGTAVPGGPGLPTPSPSGGEATSPWDLSSEADRAFSLRSPQTGCPHTLPQSLSHTPASGLPPLRCPEVSRVCPARPSPGQQPGRLSNQGLSYCTPGAPSLQQLPRPSCSQSHSPCPGRSARALLRPKQLSPNHQPRFSRAAPGALQSGECFQPGFNYREHSCCWTVYIYLQDLTN